MSGLKLNDLKLKLQVNTTAKDGQNVPSIPHPLLASPRVVAKQWTTEEILQIAPSIDKVQLKLKQFFHQWLSEKHNVDMMDEWLGKIYRIYICP